MADTVGTCPDPRLWRDCVDATRPVASAGSPRLLRKAMAMRVRNPFPFLGRNAGTSTRGVRRFAVWPARRRPVAPPRLRWRSRYRVLRPASPRRSVRRISWFVFSGRGAITKFHAGRALVSHWNHPCAVRFHPCFGMLDAARILGSGRMRTRLDSSMSPHFDRRFPASRPPPTASAGSLAFQPDFLGCFRPQIFQISTSSRFWSSLLRSRLGPGSEYCSAPWGGFASPRPHRCKKRADPRLFHRIACPVRGSPRSGGAWRAPGKGTISRHGRMDAGQDERIASRWDPGRISRTECRRRPKLRRPRRDGHSRDSARM